MDRFDEVLRRVNDTYGLSNGPQPKAFSNIIVGESVSPGELQALGLHEDGDRILVQSVLLFSRLLLEKCGNRTLYNSTERLNDILNTTSLPLLHEALRLTLVLAQRFADRGPQNPSHSFFYHFGLDKLQKLATPIPRLVGRQGPQSPVKASKSEKKATRPHRRAPTTADPNDFRALARQNGSTTSDRADDLDWPQTASLRVVWTESNSSTQPAASNASLPASPTPLRQQSSGTSWVPASTASAVQSSFHEEQSDLRVVELVASDLEKSTPQAIIHEKCDSMPEPVKYEFLHKLRTAYGLLESGESRNMLLYIRLTALGVIGQIYSEDEFTTKYFDGDGNIALRQQLIQQLVELLRPDKTGRLSTLYIQCLAMETLAILSRYRQMAPEILSTLAPNSSHGLLITLVQRGIVNLAQQNDGSEDAAGDDWRHAVFMLWTIFMSQTGPHNTRSVEQFVHKNLIVTYASGLRVTSQRALRVHVPILKFLEYIFHHFKDGLQVLNANGAFTIACETAEKLSKEALQLFQDRQGIAQEWKTAGVDFKIPYLHQYVLRELIGLVKDVSKHQGNHADRALRGFVDSASLLNAFRLVLSHMEEFGAHTWSEVVTTVCSFLNNEPTSFTVVSEAGIVSTLLSTVQPQQSDQKSPEEMLPRTISVVPQEPSLKLPPIADAILNVATSFSAICLTEAGSRQFVSSGVLEKFFELFESPEHVKAIRDSNFLVQLGGTFDELVRHHPSLKNLVVSAIITMVARVRHICRVKLRMIGAGPKLWSYDASGLLVDGGIGALMADGLPHLQLAENDFEHLELPNKDILDFDVSSEKATARQDLARSASDKDSHGLTALDYARPVIGFLAAFFDTHFLCKETLNAGATDLILDLVTLPTLPITDDAFSEGLLMQDLAAVVRLMADEKPHLVLPLLVDRARFICDDSLTGFINHQSTDMQCYFAEYLDTRDKEAGMDVDSASTQLNGTKLVRGLMSIYCIARALSEVFGQPSYTSRQHHNTTLAHVNIADVLSEVVGLFGRLSAACGREEISILASVPKSWLDATKPGNYTTGDQDVDTILDLSDNRKSEQNDSEQRTIPENLKEVENTAAFRNLRSLRHLLTETPAAISAFFSRVSSSFSGRKKPETFFKQKLVIVAESIAHALTYQLRPPFLPQPSSEDVTDNVQDWRFKYFTVVLSRVRDSLWEDNGQGPTGATCQPFIMDCFRRSRGMNLLSDIGREFFKELAKCKVDKPVVFAANAGLKICLEIFEDTTRSELVTLPQASYMKNDYMDRPFYFNPNQLLLEVRMESLSLTREIWDSEYAEQASADVVRRLASILKHTLHGDNEDSVAATADEYPKPAPHIKRLYSIDKTRVKQLVDKGFEPAVVEEALYRCNVGQNIQLSAAEDYCQALKTNSRRRRLPAPKDEIKSLESASNTPSNLTSPPITADNANGPTATILEDRSQDEDVTDVLDITRPDSNNANRGAVLAVNGENTPNGPSAMDLSVILNEPATTQTLPPQFSKQSIDAERESIREQLAERCNNILSSHPKIIFELHDLLSSGAAKLSDEDAKSWWTATTNILVSSLLSQGIEGDVDEAYGKKVAATAHLIGLLSNNTNVKDSMHQVMQDSFDNIVDFLKIPGEKASDGDTYPWIAPISLIVERMLALDSSPNGIEWTAPNDVDNYTEPKLIHEEVIEPSARQKIFEQVMDLLPKVGKDSSMALALSRVLLILTRHREIARLQGQKRNLQRLFVMVKQLHGRWSPKLQGCIMTILRHIIEDDATIKQIMTTEIKAYFHNRPAGRSPDLANYLRDLTHLALRSPTLFVEVSNQSVKLLTWSPGHQSASSPLGLRDEDSNDPAAKPTETFMSEATTKSIEADAPDSAEQDKAIEAKMPIVENPDGVIHFILTELLAYKDIEDREPTTNSENNQGTGDISASTLAINGISEIVNGNTAATLAPEITSKSEKPRFKSDEHPVFLYRSFLLHCLTELLYSYNQTKIEFISFSRKNAPYAATPSKARSGVLNYLLNALVSSGYVDKDESVTCRKRLVTSDWAMRVLVCLCAKTGEKDLGLVTASRYANAPRQIDDKDTEPDLTYVRRFVLDHAIKSFRDATSSTESTQARYGRLLCLAELFNKLITKASPQEGSTPVANTSYKRIARMMLEKNFIAILTSAISDIDLSVPGAKKVIKFILRPLKELTGTATDLNINHPDEFPKIIDQNADVMSDASSQVSEITDDREETPDLYRNSALGMLDPARHHRVDSDEEDEEEDGMDYDDYDEDDMDYDGMGAPPNDGEVVSDEELEDAMDGPGEMEGIPGDVPMDIEFVVDRHHHEDDEDDSESDSDDEDESEDDDEDGDIEIEVEDDDVDHEHDRHEEGVEDDWEDEEDGEGEDEDGEVDFDVDDLPALGGRTGGPATHISDLLNELRGAELRTTDMLTPPNFDLPQDADVILHQGDADDPDDEDDQDDDGDDMDDDDMGAAYDQHFDMVLNDPGYDENDEWGWEEPPQPVFRRPRHARGAGFHPALMGGRRVVQMHDPDIDHLLGTRHHRHAPSARPQPEDDTHPLLQRPPEAGGMDFEVNGPGARMVSYLPMQDGTSRSNLPFMLAGGNGGPAIVTMDGNGLGGHGAILDAIMGAIQRGDPEQLMPNGQIRFNLSPPALEQLLRPPPMPIGFSSTRQPKEDPQRSVQFVPMPTMSRWQQEVQLVFGKSSVTAIHPVQTWVYAVLVPLAQADEKERRRKAEEERKAAEEREAQRKAEDERLQKAEEEERQAKEKAEEEEHARLVAEREADRDTQSEGENAASDGAMEGVQESGLTVEAEATEEPVRRYTTIRGRQLDITGLDIDVEYLEALPEDLREEVITAQYQARREQAQEQGNDDSAIDQEFLDALPEDIREEIRAQEAASQRRRDRERARREAQASAGGAQPGEMEPDDFLASLEPALRRAILAEQPQEILNALNPQHAAEGRAHARSIFYHRSPMAAALENARGREREREARRQQIVQLIDNAGVATLLRLMFIQQQGSLKANLLNILSQVCGNRQTRYQVVSLLLVVLKEGSTDVTAIERSLASLSLRAKGAGPAKTPQPLKRTLSMQPHGGLSEEVTPIMVVQQCLHALSYICSRNAHVKNIFLREADVTSANKAKGKSKGKSKESKTTTHPVNDLISLLDRQLIMDNSGCLHHLASLLAVVTNPLAALMRQEKERQKAEKEKEEKANEAAKEDSEKKGESGSKDDVVMNDVPNSQDTPKPIASAENDEKDDAATKGGDLTEKKDAEQEKRKPFDPPTITEHNLKLITNIFVAPECGQETFKSTLETLRSLSHIPGTSEKFGKELTSHVHTLSQAICNELDELLPAIKDAQSSMDVQGAAAARFSASTSDQVKLLRVLQALDYLTAPRKEEDADQPAKSILTLSYEHLGLSSLWLKLGECLTAVEEKGDTISFANILLPLIESLMVVCKHTTLKDTPIQVKEAALTSPVAPTYHDELEELFFKFTSDHRKILNDIVRQNPKLMQGQFAILAKNSKVLDFDNKRQYFNKQIHSRHHAQRHPQPPLQLNVRREQVFIDSYKALYFKTADEMKYGKLNIRFNGEEGVDAGGVTREWFQVLARGMFDPNYALFQPVASDKTTFHPSALSKVNDEHLLYFKFIGRIIGKALHEGRVLDCHFSRAVYKRILGKKPNLKDLESNDVDYYKSLCWILENDITDILTEEFCVIEDEFGEEKVIDLIPDGRNIAVTEENKKEYVQKLVEYRLTESVKDQLDNFLTGFHDIIPAELIAIFNEQELELLISGLPEIDVDDWKANTEYHNYNPSSQQVVWFWRIVKAMTNEERAKLLQFITGTSKVPLNGFKELEGVSGLTRCNIHKDPSTNRLPTSHTCFNQLDLPAYESFEVMKQNITTAISLGADYFGFA